MSTRVLFEPGSPTFNELIGNGKMHIVPKYQRDYSWDYEEWDDLWNDIEGLIEENIHYMGYVVLQRTTDSRKFTIIDGQQRITTLSIIALAAIKLLQNWVDNNIEPNENKLRIEILKNQFIGFTSASSLMPISKLELNRNNDDFYKSYLLRLRKPKSVTKLKPSEKKMWNAFEFFYNKLNEKFSSQKDGASLSIFLEKEISDKLIFTSITVGDDLNAYKVFETLNARGVKLSTSDLLKNYLFAEVARNSEHDLDEAERQWQKINDILQKIDLPTFLRHYWNSIYKLETKTTLFKAIKNKIKEADAVFDLLKDLEDLAPVYVALGDSGNDLWNKEQSAFIEELSLFGATQWYTLMMGAYRNIKPKSEQEFTKILRDIAVVIFRYNTISQFNPNVLEQQFNKTSNAISNGSIETASSVFNSFSREIYISDELFESNFSYRSINTNRYRNLVRYILCKLERQISELPIDWTDSKVSIEHILPENPSQHWELSFDRDQQEEYVFRLGNLTLLEVAKNKECGAGLFDEKRTIYDTSKYMLTKKETAYTEWKPVTVLKRQQKMASLAKTVWKVQY